jgi:hypothetical protein
MEHTVQYIKHVCQPSSNESLPSVGLVPSVLVMKHTIISQNRLPTVIKATVLSVGTVSSVWLETLGRDYMYRVPHQYPEYTWYNRICIECLTFYTRYKSVHSGSITHSGSVINNSSYRPNYFSYWGSVINNGSITWRTDSDNALNYQQWFMAQIVADNLVISNTVQKYEPMLVIGCIINSDLL